MRVGLIGRSQLLLETAKRLLKEKVDIAFLYTCRSEDYYSVGESDFESFATENSIPFFSDLKIVSRQDELARYQADICLSINWMTVLPPRFLDAFPHGVLNAHAGDLPRYRGNACPNWAILNFEKEVCLSIHKMTQELDAGPVLLKRYLPIDESTYIGDVYQWLEGSVPEAFAAAIKGLEGGTLQFVPQDEGIKPLRVFPRRPEDSKIDWHAPARDVMALIRASSRPFQGAFCYLERDTEVKIFRANAARPDYDFCAIPGQVCTKNGANPVIAAADGLVEIVECASPGADDASTKKKILSSLRNRLQ